MPTDDVSVAPSLGRDQDAVLVINAYAADGTPAKHIKIRAGPSRDFDVKCLMEYYEYAGIIVCDPVLIGSWNDYIATQRGLDPEAEFIISSDDASIRQHVLDGSGLLFGLRSPPHPAHEDERPAASAAWTMVLMILPALFFIMSTLLTAGRRTYDALLRTAYDYKPFLLTAYDNGHRTF